MPFTVEFNDDGTINRVFKVGISEDIKSVLGQRVDPYTEQTRAEDVKALLSANLRGRAVSNITTVTIVTANDATGSLDPCLWQFGKLYHW